MDQPDRPLETVAVPREFLTYPGSPRDPDEGNPTTAFRYDEDFVLLRAGHRRGAALLPSFYDGMRTQAVVDAVLQSAAERRWVDVADVPAVTAPLAAALSVEGQV